MLMRYFGHHNIRYNVASRLYHCFSDDGVFGYRYRPKAKYQVPEDVLKSRRDQQNVYQWTEAYRTHGHRIAQINPVEFMKTETDIPELNPERYGLSLDNVVNVKGIIYDNDTGASTSIATIEKFLRNRYCSTVSAEFAYIESEEEREWLKENYEKYLAEQLTINDKIEIVDLLIRSQVWDNFLAIKFPTVKRYGGEGAESMLAFFRQILLSSVENDVKNIVLGMNHRGKLNLLTLMMNTRPAKMFRHYKGLSILPDDAKVMGDIPSHFHVSDDLTVNGKTVRMCMLHNPSHLEAVNPVSMGKARSKHQHLKSGPFTVGDDINPAVLNIQLHGDAAFPGQGINQEMLMMAATPHFDVGGSIHMIVNNQVGFTTPGDRGRGTRYCTDLAKSIMAPVFHVNVDDPERLTLVTRLAFDYWRKFQKDIFIDLYCFRRWGHNELDDPTFTNPLLYQQIHARKSVPDTYAEYLINKGDVLKIVTDRIATDHKALLTKELENVDSYKPETNYFNRQWSGLQQATNNVTYWDTGIDYDLLRYVGEQSVSIPKTFNIHPHLFKTHVTARLKKIELGTKIDYSTAEAFAIGSLLYQGHNVRLCGEDVGRGTFSHRHVMLVDQKTNEIYIPLNAMPNENCGKLEVANSILSEEAVLGFEYGMAIDNPNNLYIWEAQFGDFFNGAQIIFDTFILSGETKWLYCNGLVILLPHGYDGAGSEHSSCRIERFLQQTDSRESSPDGDDVNFNIINPTTPAQYYHALRRQIVRNFRKPLIVVSPKTLLRLSEATSNYSEFQPGQYFKPVLDDPTIDAPHKIKRIILCSGKHFYNLSAEKIAKKYDDVAIIRLESLCPFPVNEINQTLDRYKNAQTFIWSQEEPRNMGAWTFIRPRFENMCGHKIKYYGREEGATTAVGTSSWHKVEASDVITGPFIIK